MCCCCSGAQVCLIGDLNGTTKKKIKKSENKQTPTLCGRAVLCSVTKNEYAIWISATHVCKWADVSNANVLGLMKTKSGMRTSICTDTIKTYKLQIHTSWMFIIIFIKESILSSDIWGHWGTILDIFNKFVAVWFLKCFRSGGPRHRSDSVGASGPEHPENGQRHC